jgi:uncharacterized protein (TIGR00369 family)
MSGLDMLRANIIGRLPDAPISRLTGLRLSEVGHGMASAAMPASLWWQTGAGVFFSGTVAFVADLPLGCAVLTIAPPGVGVASSELSVSFLRAATIRSQTLIGRARLIHGTRSLGLAEATIEDGRGRLLGHATSRCVLFPLDPEVASARQTGDERSASPPVPYLADIEGEVYGQEYWDATPGIEAVRGTVTGTFVPPAFRLMGLRGVEANEGQVSMAMATSGWLVNPRGVIYGGAIAWLADATMSLTTLTTIPAATAFGPLDLKIHFLRPVIPGKGELTARAKVVHRGRTIAVTHCDIFDAQDKLAAQATASQLILPGRPWDRPLHVADEFTDDAGRVLVTVLFIDMVDSSRHADRLAIESGALSWWTTTPRCGSGCSGSKAARSTTRVTDSSFRSTVPVARYAARRRSVRPPAVSDSRFVQVSMPANASKAAASWSASPSISAHVWPRWLRPVRSSSPARSRISSVVPGSRSKTEAGTR